MIEHEALILTHTRWSIRLFSGLTSLSTVVGIGFALHFDEEVLAVALEERVTELNLLGRALALVEVVHVELADEGVKVTVFEVGGQSGLYKSLFVAHVEACALGRPLDHARLRMRVDDFKQFLQEHRYRLFFAARSFH